MKSFPFAWSSSRHQRQEKVLWPECATRNYAQIKLLGSLIIWQIDALENVLFFFCFFCFFVFSAQQTAEPFERSQIYRGKSLGVGGRGRPRRGGGTWERGSVNSTKDIFRREKWVRRLPLVHPKYFRRDPVAVRASRHVSAKYQVLIITWLFSSGQLDNTAGCDLGLSALTGRTAERWLNYNGGKCSFSPWAPGISESYRLHGVRRLTYL